MSRRRVRDRIGFGARIAECPGVYGPSVGRDFDILAYVRNALIMRLVITDLLDRRTRDLFDRKSVKGLSADVQRAALRRLLMLDAAIELGDLRVPTGNRLESLRGDLRGLQSIRVNDQWRIVFRWSAGNASEVRIVDDH